MKRIGHKGADAIEHGNTAASFHAARECGVDMIEFDVIRHPLEGGTLVLAHDPNDAAARTGESLITLEQGLDLLASSQFAQIGIDVDMKHDGYELELLAALRERELLPRTMVTSMELGSIRMLRERAAREELKLGLTIPRVTKDWLSMPPVVKPIILAGVVEHRLRQPARVAALLEAGTIDAVMAFHKVISGRLVKAVRRAGGELYAWTVDDATEIERLNSLGLDGVVSNDPRLFDQVATLAPAAAHSTAV